MQSVRCSARQRAKLSPHASDQLVPRLRPPETVAKLTHAYAVNSGHNDRISSAVILDLIEVLSTLDLTERKS